MNINLPSIRQPVIEITEDTKQAFAGSAIVVVMCVYITAQMIAIAYAPAVIVANVASYSIAVTGITSLEATVIVLSWTFGTIFIVYLFRKQLAKLINKIDVLTNLATSLWNILMDFIGKR